MNERILTALWFDRGISKPEWLLAFEAYGHAMACASALELQLSLYLCKHRMLRHHGGDAISQDEFIKYAKSIRTKSMPKLITEVRKKFHLSKGLIDGLYIAKGARDALAHTFWDTNLGLLHTAEGIELIVEQCTFDCWHFKNICDDLEREIGYDVFEFVQATQRRSAWAAEKMNEVLNLYR